MDFHKSLLVYCGVIFILIAGALSMNLLDGIPRCLGCHKPPCEEIVSCPEDHYLRSCTGCCKYCASYLKEGEECLQSGDLIIYRIGECVQDLVCDWTCKKAEDVKRQE